MSNRMFGPLQIIGPSDNPYPGTVCIPQVPLPVNASVQPGDKATIQLVELAQHGAALFSVRDTLPAAFVFFLETQKGNKRQLTDSPSSSFSSASTSSSRNPAPPRSPSSMRATASTRPTSALPSSSPRPSSSPEATCTRSAAPQAYTSSTTSPGGCRCSRLGST